MRNWILILSFLVLTSCSTFKPSKTDFVTPIGFQPVAPIDITEQFDQDVVLLAEFPNDAVSVAVRKIKEGGSVVYGPAVLSMKGSTYEVKVDYIKYRTQQYPGSEEILREGFGVRMIASIQTSENNIDLGSLYALGVAAEQSKLTGTLTMETMGISGETITPLIPIPSKIDVSTIQNVLQAAAAIKSKIYDNSNGVSVRPQVLSFKRLEYQDSLSTKIEAESSDIEKTIATPYQGGGWIYFGHFVDGAFLETGTTNTQSIPVINEKYKLTNKVNVRSGYPVFPMYRLGNKLGVYEAGTTVKVHEVQSVGRNKIWARVERISPRPAGTPVSQDS